MTERELIDELCDLRPAWSERRAAIHASAIYHVDGADLGRQLVNAVFDGVTEPWVRAGFAVIERALIEGTSDTRGLVIVGLFESMQGVAYHRADPPDALADWLGPRSLQAWADLIEGWTGTGIRSVAAWRRVIINGPRDRIAFTSESLQFTASAGAVEWRRGDAQGRWQPSEQDFEHIVAPLRPLVAVRQIERAPFGDMQAMIDVDGAQGPAIIMIGGLIGGEVEGVRIARHGERWFAIDYARLITQWAWLPDR